MIDYDFAYKNIGQYKFDYYGYLVIIDSIRTKDLIIENNDIKMHSHLNLLKEKYKYEIMKINSLDKSQNNDDKKTGIIEELNRLIHILPVIGFIKMGLGKMVGVD